MSAPTPFPQPPREPSSPVVGGARGVVTGAIATMLAMLVMDKTGGNEVYAASAGAGVNAILSALGKWGRDKGGWQAVVFGSLF